jgi:hypothetical protein
VHLKAAASLVPRLVQAQRSLRITNMHDPDCIWQEDQTTVAFLLGGFLWVDILSSISLRSKPLLELSHESLLAQDSTLIKMFGCDSRTLLLLVKINKLDNWKKEREKSGILSVVELAKRGAEIEVELEQVLQMPLKPPTNAPGSTRLAALSSPQGACSEFSRIFALAATTYLHVVISGAYPSLPEISSNVITTLRALHALRDTALLGRLVWPFCVTGCLALEKYQELVQETVRAQTTENNTLEQAFKVVQQCWKDRRAGLRNCDWTSSMESMGQCILLL